MKRSLSKTSSAPEPLPRISHRKKTTSNKRQPESKSTHYSDLDISSWRPLTEADTMPLPVMLHNRPTQIDRGRPSEKQGSLSDRSLPFRRDSDVSFTQGMVTILRTEDAADDDLMFTPTHLYASGDLEVPEGSPVPAHSHTHSHCHGLELGSYLNTELGIIPSLGRLHHRDERKNHLHIRVPANKEVPRRSPVPAHSHTHSHCHGLELGTYVNSGLGINHSLGHFHHRDERKNHLHIRVPANKEVPRRSPVPAHSHTHSHCHGLELGTYVNSGLGINHSLGHFHHRDERKNHLHIRVPAYKEVPRRSPVPAHSHTHSHCHGLELGTYVNSGLGINHSLGHFHHREDGKHSSSRFVLVPGGGGSGPHAGPRPRHESFDRHTHRPRHVKITIGPPTTPAVSPTGDHGVPVHLCDLRPRGDHPPARSSVIEFGGQGNYIHSRTLRDVQPEDEQNTQNDDAKVTRTGLTQEVLTSGLYSDSEQREDRISDWLEECDGELTPASLPPHLPEIDSQRRCKPSTG